MSDEKSVDVQQRGLKRLRASHGGSLRPSCENCGCRRYSPCTCKKKGGKNAMATQVVD
jgi:hypothetical protein